MSRWDEALCCATLSARDRCKILPPVASTVIEVQIQLLPEMIDFDHLSTFDLDTRFRIRSFLYHILIPFTRIAPSDFASKKQIHFPGPQQFRVALNPKLSKSNIPSPCTASKRGDIPPFYLDFQPQLNMNTYLSTLITSLAVAFGPSPCAASLLLLGCIERIFARLLVSRPEATVRLRAVPSPSIY